MNDVKQYISQDSIRNLMKDGATADQIAKAFSEQLNAVLAERQKDNEKEKQAQSVVDFLTKYYPVIFDGLTVEVFLKALNDLNDVLSPIANSIEKLAKELDNKEKAEKPSKPDANMSFEDLLKVFGK